MARCHTSFLASILLSPSLIELNLSFTETGISRPLPKEKNEIESAKTTKIINPVNDFLPPKKPITNNAPAIAK